MKVSQLILQLSLAVLVFACGSKKATDDGKEESTNAPASGSDVVKGQPEPAPAPVESLLKTYPAVIGVFPLSAPNPGRSLYLGVSTDGTQPFQFIWVYAVAAVPDFSFKQPNVASQAEFDAFMNKWAEEFKADQALVAQLNKLATDFAFKFDPAFLTDAALAIPAASTAGQQPYIAITQKFFARRLTAKAAGNTTISAVVEGAQFTVPVTITGYTSAQLSAGKARYDAAQGGCVGCHGNATTSQDAFLKHSSDYLAYATDLEIMGLVKTSKYPDGTVLNNGAHTFTFADAAAEAALVGYLRSFPTSFDKIQGVQNQPAALRLR